MSNAHTFKSDEMVTAHGQPSLPIYSLCGFVCPGFHWTLATFLLFSL